MQKNISNSILLFLLSTIFMFYPLCGMEKEQEKNCIICFDEKPKETLIDLDRKIIGGPGFHFAHLACINEWRESKNKNAKKCPLCSSDVSDANIKAPYFIYASNDGFFFKRLIATIFTTKSLILPTLSLGLPWVFNQDISRESLIAKGCMAAGFYCLLTPYSTGPTFCWFPFERLKRMVGYTLALGGYIHMVNPITLKSCVSQAIALGTGIEFSLMVSELDVARSGRRPLDYSKSVDIRGAVPVGIGLLVHLEHKIKFFEKNVSPLIGSKAHNI